MPAVLDLPAAIPADWAADEWATLQAALTRRKLIGGGLALGLLTACGGAVPTPTAPAPVPRAYTDDEGRQVNLPASAERVVVLDPNRTTALLVDLGLVPVGATTNTVNPGGRFAPTLGVAAERIQPVGVIGQADIEKIAQLRPDLILLNTGYGQVGLDQLAMIAPTVAFKFRPTLTESFQHVAEVVGRQAEAERRIAEYNRILDTAAATANLRGRVGNLALLYIAQPTFGLYGPKTLFGDIVARLGVLLRPEAVDGKPLESAASDISMERIGPLLDAETIFLMRYYNAEGADANFDAMSNNPVWRSVPAVRRGRVVTLNIQELGSYGLRGVEQAVERLARDFAALPA